MSKKLNIPTDWNSDFLGNLASISTGSKNTQDKIKDGKYPFFVRSQTVKKINSYSFDGEAVLTAGDGAGTGKVFHFINGKFDFHQRVYKISDFKNQLYSRYFFEYFRQNFIRQVVRYSAKTSVDSVRMEMLTKMKIPLPSIHEQKKISQILFAWEDAIESVEDLIKKKKLVRKRFYQDLICGALYSQNTHTVRLSDLFNRIKDKNSENNKNVLTISAQDGLVSQLDYFNKDVSGKSLLGYYIIQKGDFAYNRSYSNGYPFGAIKRLEEYDKGVVSTLYLCFRPKSNKKINSDFYMHFFEAGGLNRATSKIAQEGARNHGLLNIPVNDFLTINIPHPDVLEQDKIANILNTINKELNLLIDKKRLLTKQKKGLMQRLLTGKVRVN